MPLGSDGGVLLASDVQLRMAGSSESNWNWILDDDLTPNRPVLSRGFFHG